MNPSAAMLFTAGFGTRMGSLTQDRPKPLIEVGDQPPGGPERAFHAAQQVSDQRRNRHHQACGSGDQCF